MKPLKKMFFVLLLLCLALAACQRPESESSASSRGSGVDVSTPANSSSSAKPPALGVSTSQVSEPVSGPGQEPDAELSGEPNNTLYVLMYHLFVLDDQPCNEWTVTNGRFREDLQWLADHGYTTVLPRELAAGEPLPEKAVMLTFDDGYDSNFWLAFPLLKEFQAKAAIALITSHIDDEELYYLNWPKCQEMLQSGLVEFGSHTHAVHGSEYGGIKRAPNETKTGYRARVIADLQTSIDRIEENLAVTPTYFAYPLGMTEEWADDFIRQHFSVTVTTMPGSADITQGLYSMNRYTVDMENPVSEILPS